MNYEKWTRQALIDHIASLEALLGQYRAEREEEEHLNYAWAGNLGHWYWDYQANKVTFNPLKALSLGFTRAEIPALPGFEFFTERLHPEDYARVMDNMRGHLRGELPAYEVEYRIQTKDGGWRWFYDIGRVTRRDENGRPLMLAGIVFDITERKELQARLEEQNRLLQELATHDGLTGLLNHRTLVARLEEEVRRAGRYPYELAVLLLDIDHFKQVNDTYGHPQGDSVLKETAQIMLQQIRDLDVAGRYGGEEFLLIFPNTNLAAAAAAAERIRMAIAGHTFSGGVRVTVSGGLAQFDKEDAATLVARADRCLYHAKNSGRNRIASAPVKRV